MEEDFDIKDYLSKEAMLEQTAEECSELAQACLKLARKLRGENPTPKTEQECLTNLTEEIADVIICVDFLVNNYCVVPAKDVDSMCTIKTNRLEERLKIKEI